MVGFSECSIVVILIGLFGKVSCTGNGDPEKAATSFGFTLITPALRNIVNNEQNERKIASNRNEWPNSSANFLRNTSERNKSVLHESSLDEESKKHHIKHEFPESLDTAENWKRIKSLPFSYFNSDFHKPFRQRVALQNFKFSHSFKGKVARRHYKKMQLSISNLENSKTIGCQQKNCNHNRQSFVISNNLNINIVRKKKNSLFPYLNLQLQQDSFIGCTEVHELCLQTNDTLTNSFVQPQWCLCTKECEEFGNCCWNFEIEKFGIEAFNRIKYSCTKTRKSSGFYVVSSCPSSWRNDYVRLQCEDTKEDKSNSLLAIPVSSKVTLSTYRNVYCAVCNEDTNAEFWKLELACPKTAGLSKEYGNFSGCETKFSNPNFAVNNKTIKLPLMGCISDLVNRCPEEWMMETANKTAMEIAAKCILIYSPVSMFGMHFAEKFKNKYCAICNGISDENSLCPVSEGQSPPISPMPSLSLLLDMDFQRGGLIVGSNERCPVMYLYDPLNQTCRNIMCAHDYEFEDGECVVRSSKGNVSQFHKTNHADYNTSVSKGCLLATFAHSEVSMLDNGSLVLRRDGTLRQPWEYEKADSNNTVNVCVPRTISDRYVASFSDAQGYITAVGISISLISLLIKIVLSLLIPEAKKLSSKIVLFLSISLFASQSLFVFGISKTENHALCVCIGIFMHYGFLSTFFWINALAYDIWKTFSSATIRVQIRYSQKQLCHYCLYGWITPMIIILIAMAFNWFIYYPPLNPQYGKVVCWISNRVALLVFFGVPLCILIMSNAIFFGVTGLRIRKTTFETKFALENTSDSQERELFVLYCKLSCIAGVTWLLGFMAAFFANTILWYLFVVFNSIQGVYILVAFTHFRMPSYLTSNRFLNWKTRHSTMSKSSLTLTASISKV